MYSLSLPFPLVTERTSWTNTNDLESEMQFCFIANSASRNFRFSSVPTVAKTLHPCCIATLEGTSRYFIVLEIILEVV